MGLRTLINKFRYNYYKRIALNSYVTSDFEKAIYNFLKIIEFEPKAAGINFNIGLAYINLKKYKEADKYVAIEIKNHGHGYPTDKAMAEIAFLSGNREKALKYFRKSLNYKECENKDFIKTRIGQCESKETFQQLKQSVELFEKACEMMSIEKYDEASQLLQESLKNDPKNYNALNNLGTISMNINKDYERAEKYFSSAYEISKLPAISSNLSKLAKLKSQGAY
jgi:tetratricopeptide (TPR) repeat protein